MFEKVSRSGAESQCTSRFQGELASFQELEQWLTVSEHLKTWKFIGELLLNFFFS